MLARHPTVRVMELIAKLKDVMSHLVPNSPGGGNEHGTDRDLVGEGDYSPVARAIDIYGISDMPIDGLKSTSSLEACLGVAVPGLILWRDRHQGSMIHEAHMRTKQIQSTCRDRRDKHGNCSAQHAYKVLES